MRFCRAGGAGGSLWPSQPADVRRHAGEMALTERYRLCPSEGERKHPVRQVVGKRCPGQPDAGMRMCPSCTASAHVKTEEREGYGDGRRKCRLDRTDDTGHRQDVAAYCGPKKESSCRPRVPALPLPFHFSADDTPAGLPAGVPPCGGDMRVFFPSLRMLSALLTGFLPKALPCVLSDGRRTPQRFFPLQPPSCGHPA